MDAIVIGGGIVGSAIAWKLAGRGLAVALFESGKLGCEASWASAGMLAPGGEYPADSPWAKLALESLRMYPAFVAEIEEASGFKIDYRACGAIQVAYDEAEWAALEQQAGAQAAMGIRSEPVTARDTGLLRPRLAGARFFAGDAAVDPRHLIVALREACLRRGVSIREGLRVRAIRPESGGVAVETEQGIERASRVALAAGAWSGAFGLGQATIAVRGHLVGYYLQPGSIGPILRHGHTYIVQRTNGFTIAGSTEERIGFARGVNPACVADIRMRAAELSPMFGGLVPDAEWSGLRPACESGEPELRRAGGTNIWLAYGHFRNGVLLAPVTAEKLVAEMAE